MLTYDYGRGLCYLSNVLVGLHDLLYPRDGELGRASPLDHLGGMCGSWKR